MTKPVMVTRRRGASPGRRSLGRWLALFAVVFVPIVVVGFVLFPRPACACTPSFPASPVDGIIVSVNATGLTDVQGFVLRPSGGAAPMTFTLGPLENPTQFPPGHLKAHEATGAPVRVYFTTDANGQFTAYRLEDAPVPSASPSAPSSSP
jgi:hypothetical protein